jgi:hypothetical protein
VPLHSTMSKRVLFFFFAHFSAFLHRTALRTTLSSAGTSSSAFAPAFALQMTLSSPLLRFSTLPLRGRMEGWTQMTSALRRGTPSVHPSIHKVEKR